MMDMEQRQERKVRDLPGWIMTAIGMLWLAVFPFLHDGSYSRITRAKWVCMLALTGVTALGAVCALAIRWRQGEKPRFGWPQAAGVAYFTLVALSALWGSWADHSGESGRLTVIWGAHRYEGLITQLCYGAIFLGMSVTRVRLRPLLHAVSIGLLGYGAFVALQYASVNVMGLFPPGTSIRTNYEFQGPIGNIDMVVGYVSVAMAAALGGFVWLRRGNPLWLAAGVTGAALLLCMEVQCGLIMLAALLFLLLMMALARRESRARALLTLAGVLGAAGLRLLLGLPWLDGTEQLCLRLDVWLLLPLGAGLLLALLSPVIRRWPGPQVSPRAAAAVGAGMILLALLAVYALPIPEGNGLWEMQELLHGRAQDSFGSERIGVWRLTLEMSRENLLWGTGPDAFLHALDHHLWQTGQRLVQRFDNPHNLFLGALINSGLPALGMYITLTLGVPLYGLLRGKQDDETLPLALSALCYVAQGMFTFSICLVTPMFFSALGMLAGQLNERK